MRRKRKSTVEIENFILGEVRSHPKDISALTSAEFGISRPAVLGHINNLIRDGLLEVEGRSRGRRYKLKLLTNEIFSFNLSSETEEHEVWRHIIRPMLRDIPENVLRICEYGINEMVNNAIDHSEGSKAEIHAMQTASDVSFLLQDNGVGIFNKIQRDLGLSEKREAILELSKGKLTTDPSRHTGEGIFFVSRMFDRYVVFSDGLFYSPNKLGDQEIRKYQESNGGTGVYMLISSMSKRTVKDVFDRYTSDNEGDYSFSKTDVPVSLSNFGGSNLVSRSQARRLLARLQEFTYIKFDFSGVDSISQAFADEIFRVYAKNNPSIEITTLNTNADIERMIRRVSSLGRKAK